MKVTISVGGKFHAFHLARQLEKRGYLNKIFTSYPWFKVKKSGVSKEKVKCLVLKEALGRVLSNTPYLNNSKIGYYMANLFDYQVANRIKPCDIFVGWSGFSLYTIRKIYKSFLAKTILERGSNHIEAQRDILMQESRQMGVRVNLPSMQMVEKELEEYRQADYISVPSTLAKETFLNKGFPQEKIIQVPLGVDIEAFKPITKKDSTFRIISTGITMRKGIHYLLQAIDELKIRDLELWLIGNASDDVKPFLKRYLESFKYLGEISHKELYEYYSQGSIFVLFSLEDGFGMVLLEAMACGLPVICSTQTGAKDVVRDGVDGFIVATRDIEALKEKITYLYENPAICKAMGESAKERVSNNFTWNDYGERIINAYLKVSDLEVSS